MARLARAMGKTAFGLWLWQVARKNGVAGVVINAVRSALRAGEWAVLRSLPANRRHDAAADATLAAFEAETRALQANQATHPPSAPSSDPRP